VSQHSILSSQKFSRPYSVMRTRPANHLRTTHTPARGYRHGKQWARQPLSAHSRTVHTPARVPFRPSFHPLVSEILVILLARTGPYRLVPPCPSHCPVPHAGRRGPSRLRYRAACSGPLDTASHFARLG